MSTDPQLPGSPIRDLWQVYDDALPSVYGYLLRRTGSVSTAEDLTSETVVAAIDSASRGRVDTVTVAWVVGIARHKLVDHWRRRDRDQDRRDRLEAETDGPEDPWGATIDRLRAQQVLETLTADHRAALTLRYLDGLAVPDVAHVLERSVHATESLLVRARAAFRSRYTDDEEQER